MIEQIKLVLTNESGDVVPIGKVSSVQLEMKIEVAIADIFSKICFLNNNIKDEEIKLAEKFNLAKNLKNYLEEMNNGNCTTN